MNQTQVTFMSDAKLKEKALKKTKREGITLKALLTMAMRAYIHDDLRISLHAKNEFYDDVFADKEIIEKTNKLSKSLKKINI